MKGRTNVGASYPASESSYSITPGPRPAWLNDPSLLPRKPPHVILRELAEAKAKPARRGQR